MLLHDVPLATYSSGMDSTGEICDNAPEFAWHITQGEARMDVKQVPSLQAFNAQKMQKVNLFETERMFCDIYCFEPGQEQKTHTHAGSDKIYYVLEGRGTFSIGGESRELPAQTAVIAPSDVEHGVVNTGSERLVLLVYMAPKP